MIVVNQKKVCLCERERESTIRKETGKKGKRKVGSEREVSDDGRSRDEDVLVYLNIDF